MRILSVLAAALAAVCPIPAQALLFAEQAPATGPTPFSLCVLVVSDAHGTAYSYFKEGLEGPNAPKGVMQVDGPDDHADDCDAVVKLTQGGSRTRIGAATAELVSAYSGETLATVSSNRFWMPPSTTEVAQKILAALGPGTKLRADLLAESEAYDEENTVEETPAAQTAQTPRPAEPSEPAASAPLSSEADKPAYSLPQDPTKFAVIVGVEHYKGIPPARFAARDAAAVRAHLTALGYPPRNTAVLTEQEATRAGLSKTLNAWLPNRVKPDSTVFFYFSGHGAPDPKTGLAYLVPIDGDPEYLEDTAYPVKQLYAKLRALKAKRVIVALDSCFSGAGGRSVLARDARPLVSRAEMGDVGTGGLVSLSASDGAQISGAIDDEGHGAFTYYLLKGLNGAARNASGAVTVKSLYDYLVPQVQDAARLHNRDQTPQLAPASAGADVRLR